MVAAVLWLFVLVLLTLALGGLWGDYLDNKFVRFVLAPGFLVVLLLKHLACLCAVAKTRESKPFGPGDEAKALLARADALMYRVKRAKPRILHPWIRRTK